MALARIVTSTPEQVAALAEYLQSRGYTVELVAPGAVSTSPADLEMDLEGCTAKEAMSRAVAAAEAGQALHRRAVAYDITGRPVEFAEEEEPAAEGGNALAQAWNGLASAWREIRDNLRLSIGHLREWIEEGRETIQRKRAQHEQTRREAEALEQRREREARRLAREAERARMAQEEGLQQAEEERSRREREEAARLAEAERLRHEYEEAARQAELAMAQERILQQEERARQDERAERERRVLEQYRREARAEVVRERFQVEQDRIQHQVAAAETLIVRSAAVRRPAPRLSPRDGDWKRAAAVSIVLALIATLGYAAYENRRPAAPLTNRDLVNSQNVSQGVPFGAATVAPPQVAVPPPSHGALPQSDSSLVRKAAVRASQERRLRRPSRSDEDEMIADDEVIVHRKGSSPARAASTATGPKRISDLDE